MAVGKNRKLGRKGKKKRVTDVFLKKDWYHVVAPSMFSKRDAGLTLCTKTTGQKIASETLRGRIFECSLADLNENPDMAYRKIKLCADDIQGDKILTTFHGMDLTRDKLCSLIKKWQSLIEARVDVKTTDGYTLRLFAVGFTSKSKNQMKKTWYAQTGQIRQIRAKMVSIMLEEGTKTDMKDFVSKLLTESVGKEMEKACEGIYPMQNVYVRKVKVLKKPKFDLTKLMEMHADNGNDVGAKVDREDPAVKEETVTGAGGRY